MTVSQCQASARRYKLTKVVAWMIFIATCLLKTSDAFLVGRATADGLPVLPPTASKRRSLLSLTSSSYNPSISAFQSVQSSENPDSPFFWGCERSTEEIEQFVTDAMLSVDPTLTPQVKVVSAEPPLVVMHNFIPPGDCYAILEATKEQEMQRSTMGASQEESQERTSSTAWLAESLCEGPLRRLAEKTSRICQLPPSHMENLQVVQYQPGQEFQLHTDHLNSFNDLECKGRLATCLIYLDSPEKGGKTNFPEFGVEVPPTKGSAVFFWNTLERPGMKGYEPNMFLHADPKLRHAGLPVLEGEKWVCNRWIHPIDYGAGVRGTTTRQSFAV